MFGDSIYLFYLILENGSIKRKVLVQNKRLYLLLPPFFRTCGTTFPMTTLTPVSALFLIIYCRIVRNKGDKCALTQALFLADNAIKGFFLAPNFSIIEKLIKNMWVSFFCCIILDALYFIGGIVGNYTWYRLIVVQLF